MTQEERLEQFLHLLNEVLRTTPFTIEYKAKKNPQGIKIVYEVTQEQLTDFMRMFKERHKIEINKMKFSDNDLSLKG